MDKGEGETSLMLSPIYPLPKNRRVERRDERREENGGVSKVNRNLDGELNSKPETEEKSEDNGGKKGEGKSMEEQMDDKDKIEYLQSQVEFWKTKYIAYVEESKDQMKAVIKEHESYKLQTKLNQAYLENAIDTLVVQNNISSSQEQEVLKEEYIELSKGIQGLRAELIKDRNKLLAKLSLIK